MKAFNVYVQSLLEYYCSVWSPHLMCLMNCTEGVQRNYTEKLRGIGNLSYDERLKIPNTDRLEIRRIKFDLVLYYKMINNDVDMDTYDFFEFLNTVIRGHQFKLRINHSKNHKFLNSFCNRSVHIWTSLTSSIVTCSSIAAFKRKLKSANLF